MTGWAGIMFTPAHAAVDRYVTPDEFRYLERVAYTKGFLMVSAIPSPVPATMPMRICQKCAMRATPNYRKRCWCRQ